MKSDTPWIKLEFLENHRYDMFFTLDLNYTEVDGLVWSIQDRKDPTLFQFVFLVGEEVDHELPVALAEYVKLPVLDYPHIYEAVHKLIEEKVDYLVIAPYVYTHDKSVLYGL